jgi:hypothetical protein
MVVETNALLVMGMFHVSFNILSAGNLHILISHEDGLGPMFIAFQLYCAISTLLFNNI